MCDFLTEFKSITYWVNRLLLVLFISQFVFRRNLASLISKEVYLIEIKIKMCVLKLKCVFCTYGASCIITYIIEDQLIPMKSMSQTC